jgi:hypothetical protein
MNAVDTPEELRRAEIRRFFEQQRAKLGKGPADVVAPRVNALGRRAELRAAVTRGFFEQQRAKLAARGKGAPPVVLPRQLAPMPKSRVAEVLSSQIDDPATNSARWTALAGLAHRKTKDLLPAVVVEESVANPNKIPSRNPCPCCLARRKFPGLDGAKVCRINTHKTNVKFDSDTLVTKVTTTIRVARKWINWEVFAASVDPSNWKYTGSEFFRHSDPILDTVQLEDGGRRGWRGRLHENFDWNWNADSDAMFDNDLSITFDYEEDAEKKTKRVYCEYSLYESNMSKVWVARESGGLDVDSGHTEGVLTNEWLTVTAVKNLRHTDPELGPPGLGAMLNYMAPTVTGLWMSQAVQAGVENAILLKPLELEPVAKRPTTKAHRPPFRSSGSARQVNP